MRAFPKFMNILYNKDGNNGSELAKKILHIIAISQASHARDHHLRITLLQLDVKGVHVLDVIAMSALARGDSLPSRHRWPGVS